MLTGWSPDAVLHQIVFVHHDLLIADLLWRIAVPQNAPLAAGRAGILPCRLPSRRVGYQIPFVGRQNLGHGESYTEHRTIGRDQSSVFVFYDGLAVGRSHTAVIFSSSSRHRSKLSVYLLWRISEKGGWMVIGEGIHGESRYGARHTLPYRVLHHWSTTSPSLPLARPWARIDSTMDQKLLQYFFKNWRYTCF